MKNYCLITNIFKDKGLKVTKEIAAYIEQAGGTVCQLCTSEGKHQEKDFVVSDIPEHTDCILVLGGDGTLIRVATRVEALDIPLAGVNLGNLGYLCELECSSIFSAVDRLMEDAYTIEERMMLSGFRDGISRGKSALNDIVIHKAGDSLSILNLKVYVNGEFLTTYNADGIIVATPTGSTGYNMSAGGPIVDPKARMLLLTPINAHNLNSRSIVLGAGDVVEIELGTRRSKRDEEACVSFDGDLEMKLAVGDRFLVGRAENVTRICKLNEESFLEIMRRKMESSS